MSDYITKKPKYIIRKSKKQGAVKDEPYDQWQKPIPEVRPKKEWVTKKEKPKNWITKNTPEDKGRIAETYGGWAKGGLVKKGKPKLAKRGWK